MRPHLLTGWLGGTLLGKGQKKLGGRTKAKGGPIYGKILLEIFLVIFF